MAVLTVQQMNTAGLNATLAAATGGGDTADISNGRTFLEVNNASGGSLNVILTPGPAGPDGMTVGPKTVAVGAGVRMRIGPIPPAIYGPIVAITYSGVTSLTIAAISA